ncbi:MAG: undecaprenyl-diphosphate phosphatase [Eubacteriales bacterium]
MSFLQAIIMGIVQGLTEFLPVSSSGHLAIIRNLFGTDYTGILFEVMLHFGTLIAIFIVYYKDILKLFIEGMGIVIDFFINLYKLILSIFTSNKQNFRPLLSTQYRKFVILVGVASIPTALFGLFFKNKMETFMTTLLVPGIALLVTGTMLVFTDKIVTGRKKEEKTTYTNAFAIGVFQGLAIIPGISRSGATIVGGLLNGLEKNFAIKFSFIASIPAVLGATILEIKDIQSGSFSEVISTPYLAGTIVSAVVGFICIKTLIVLLNKKKFHWFAYYCYIVGVSSIIGSLFL